ncbi:MAG: hypothetical protein ACKVS8_07460 [Phycisphaerales bacterium]
MGITIHYSGRAATDDALRQLLTVAQLFAAQRDWMCAMYDDPLGLFEDHDPGSYWGGDPNALFRGIVITPHKKCEPVRLQFDPRFEVSGSTKTQFAPFRIHCEVVELLRAIEPFMERFDVVDESGLWASGDKAAAASQFKMLGTLMDGFADELSAQGHSVEGPGVPLHWADTDDPDDDAAADGKPAGGEDDLPPEMKPYG